MKKITLAVAAAVLIALCTPTTSSAAVNPDWPVQPPVEWNTPYHAKYMKYNGKDCWKYSRVTKCLPNK
jgi:opacity protein-like surface antigen